MVLFFRFGHFLPRLLVDEILHIYSYHQFIKALDFQMVNAIWSFGWFTVAVFLTKIMRYFWVWVIIIFYPLRGVFRRNRQTFDLHVPCIVCGATFFELAVIVLFLQLSLVFVTNPQSIPVMMDWLRGLLIEKAKTFSRIVCLLSIKKLWDMDFKFSSFQVSRFQGF